MPIATLLVVEDDALQMDMLEMILTRNDFAVIRADTGETALELLAQHAEVDLMLLDVMLPGQLDGIAVCHRVRADQTRPYLPIIMVTALGKTEQLVQGLDAGADDYLTKPFSSRELLARLQAGLRVSRAQRELAETENPLSTAGGDRARRVLCAGCRAPISLCKPDEQDVDRLFAGSSARRFQPLCPVCAAR